MKKEKTIQKKLFTNYFVLILAIVLLVSVITSFFVLDMISDNESRSMLQSASSIKSELELAMEEVNNLQKRILFSEQLKEVLFSEEEQYQNRLESLLLHRDLNQLSDSICGPEDYWNYQMNYWNSNGGCAGVGYNSFIDYRPDEIEKNDNIQEILDGNGKKVISAPHKTTWANTPTEVLSMYRSMSKKGTSDQVIIETQIRCENIWDIVEKNLKISDPKFEKYQVVIFNGSKEIIYASEGLEKYAADYVDMLAADEPAGTLKQGRVNAEEDKKRFCGIESEALGWNIWIMEPQKQYLRPLWEMGVLLLVVTCVVLIFLRGITYTLTKQLVKPIIEIHEKMKNLDLNEIDIKKEEKIAGDVKELKELDTTFNEMCLQIKDARDKLEISHENEMQARFLAMQAQMNPHFLYNILSIIKIMGKEVKSQPIVEVCTELSMMLRYISTSDRGAVTIGQEESHTLNYLKLMKTRFQERLEYEIEIADSMKEIPVPRLILQPLVENSIKYATEERPPWRIRVTGWCSEDRWYLSVRDNGSGMKEDVKEELEAAMKNQPVGQYTAVEIGGMGILNIYSRISLTYGEQAFFELKNQEEGGLEVKIGGSIHA